MASDAENIATIRSNLLAALAADSVNPKPTYAIGGQTVDRNGWRAALMQQLKDLNALADVASGPWEATIQGIP